MKSRPGLLVGAIVKLHYEDSERNRGTYDIEFEQVGCDKDHIHIFCTVYESFVPG
ncbi:hypothetical protein [Nitrosomonas sp.]|uniref:hypothetical protein n=1 Tax=Nitrosomonas sp. TaxID=42353 RepID=UPI003443728C|nr:hypothetical protein [Nitrosomonas sp.]